MRPQGVGHRLARDGGLQPAAGEPQIAVGDAVFDQASVAPERVDAVKGARPQPGYLIDNVDLGVDLVRTDEKAVVWNGRVAFLLLQPRIDYFPRVLIEKVLDSWAHA